jgi:iron complex transport system substrate-binding protein
MEHPIEELAAVAVDHGLSIHRELGPGLLESVYETVLAARLTRSGFRAERQRPVAVACDGLIFPDAFRVDIVVEDRLIIEVKSVEALARVHAKQLLTYLRLSHRPLGLLMNFGATTFRDGLRRIVNDHQDFASSRLRVHNPAQRPASA